MTILSQTPPRPKRIQEPRYLWITRVEEFKQSGLSLSRFCTAHDLKVSTLHSWILRLSKPLPAQPASTNLNVFPSVELSAAAASKVDPIVQNPPLFHPLHIISGQNEEVVPQNPEPSTGSTTSLTCPRTSLKTDTASSVATFPETPSAASPITEAASSPSTLRLIFGSFTLEIPKEVELHRVQSLLPILLSLTPKV